MGGSGIVLGLLMILAILVSGSDAAGVELNILHSNNILGHLFPCPT
jgi:hypothetical protein